MYLTGHRRPRILFAIIVILGFAGGVAFNSWRALYNETYDKRSYNTNLKALVISLLVLFITVCFAVSMFTFYQDLMTSD